MQERPLIAVVGMSGVFPRAVGISRFWHNIIHKTDATDDVISQRWKGPEDWIFDPHPSHDKAYSLRACAIEENIHLKEIGLDLHFQKNLDPMLKWVLYATQDAIAQCSIKDLDKHRIGAILASIALPTRSSSIISRNLLLNIRESISPVSNQLHGEYAGLPLLSGRVVSMPAALVSDVFGFGGGSYTLDAACASSLYAVKLACDELQFHRTDAMITGGVSGADSLYTQIGFSQLRALSPSGRCAPFDRSADGLVVGEGAGILVLKRLDDAVRDKDMIYGVIRGIGLSNDMRGNLLAPESDGQLRAMRAAYAQTGWQPWDVDYIECHGAGTPVGDATELLSLKKLWQDAPKDAGQCTIGSIKSMIGHLLTGAGAAGLIKTLLGLHHQTLPPSLKFEQASDDSPLNDMPLRVQTDPEPWPLRDTTTTRKAAVSAFGFGGINGHVLIEEWRTGNTGNAPTQRESVQISGSHNLKPSLPESEKATPIAIVGMDVCLGTLSSLKAFQHAVLNGDSALVAPFDQRWKEPAVIEAMTGKKMVHGGFVKDVTLNIGEFQIPPGEIPDILPQQLLMLKVAGSAMCDAGLPLREPRERMGTIIGISFDYEANNYNLRWILPEIVRQWCEGGQQDIDDARIDQWLQQAKAACGKPLTPTRVLGALGGIVASRVAREFRFGGPSFVVSAEEASGLRAVEIAMRLLQSGQADTMLVGAVDLACDERNLATVYDKSRLSASGSLHPFDERGDGSLPGEGAVALVLKRLEDAKQDNDRIYAVISGIGGAHGGSLIERCASTTAYRNSLEKALADAHVRPAELSLMETHGSGIDAEDKIEAEALHEVFGTADKTAGKSIAVSSTKPITGNTGAASGLASLAKTALCLFHHQLPPIPGFSLPKQTRWRNGPFHFPRTPSYWAWDKANGARTACVASMTLDGNCMHAILRQADENTDTSSLGTAIETQRQRPLGPLPFGLFVCRGSDTNDLIRSLGRLETSILNDSQSADVETIAFNWFQNNRTERSGNSTVSFVTNSVQELQSQITQARDAIQNKVSMSMGARGGVAYMDSWDKESQVAFVFPGSGNHYVGMGRRLGAQWPEVLRDIDARTDQLKTQMLPHLYDPWRSDWPPNWQTDSYNQLVSDPLHCIFGQVVFGGQMTRLLQKFNVQPNAVIPYSLGESAGLFALGAWSDHGRMLARLAESDLFKNQLTGDCLSLRKAWHLPDDHPVRWTVAVVNRKAGQVDEVLGAIPNVHRLIVNTPNECVIGGLEPDVHEAIKALGCEALFLDGVVTVHCDAALPVAEAYKDLHRFETTPVPNVRFYSCVRGEAYDITSEDTADSIMRQALEGFDFPRTIEHAYEDGVRLFLEIGPQSSCTRMIRQILEGKPHLAVAANIRGEDECLTLLKCIGTLAAAGMTVDLTPLYGYPKDHFQTSRDPGPNAVSVPVGGQPLILPPMPEKTRQQPDSVNHDPPVEQHPVDTTQISPLPAASHPVDTESTLPHLRHLSDMLDDLNANVAETARAHEQFLDLTRQMTEQFGEAFQMQNKLMGMLAGAGHDISGQTDMPMPSPAQSAGIEASQPVAFDREQCLAFAIGSVGKVLGPEFDIIDTYKARVRLPDEPLMLVDRIILVEGEKCSMGAGRVVTEHDVLPGAWYLDGGRAPVCISVEAGQADLFLSGYLGIDHQVKGERTYRLLDAKIRFHRGLPVAGETIRYDIHIDKFVKQGATYLFFFRFEGHIGDQHLITMTDGCAGFFTEQEVANSGGIILTEEDKSPGVRIDGTPFSPLLTMADEQLSDQQIDALRTGDIGRCFGRLFEGIVLPESLRLPSGRMRLIDRVVALNPQGGRWGLGTIRAEADIHPDDWFLTCHFVDDKVMPGTLMYECCAHTLRVLLLRMGWVTNLENVCYEPIVDAPCRLKCRGPVTPATQHVHYEVEIKEIGYRPEPYVVADAHMYADDHYIVFFKDMTMQMTGVTEQQIQAFWNGRPSFTAGAATQQATSRTEIFTREHILEYAVGKPSRAFGDRYKPFDSNRIIARLPGPPYCFMDRITHIEPEQWVLKADGWVEAQYDVPGNEWYFEADRSGVMPFCVLLEIALQPCGWLAAFAGSALKSRTDLKFRNLGGKAVIHYNLRPSDQTLTMRTRITKVSEAADMIIENFEYEVLAGNIPIYTGTTYFGFFTAQALATQVGLRENRFLPDDTDLKMASMQPFTNEAPLTPDEASQETCRAKGLRMPAKALRMIDGIEIYLPEGGPHGLGFVRGYKDVDAEEWFFKAHFYQDPVCPGSLGVESFIQLIKYAAMQRWPDLVTSHRFEMLCGHDHEWQYRGQIIQTNKRVVVDAVITHIEQGPEPVIMADGWLQVDGLNIYKMQGLGLKLCKMA